MLDVVVWSNTMKNNEMPFDLIVHSPFPKHLSDLDFCALTLLLPSVPHRLLLRSLLCKISSSICWHSSRAWSC